MTAHSNKDFLNARVILDGNEFHKCTFTQCVLVYSGGMKPMLHGCKFDTCDFLADGAADRTVNFIRELYRSGARDVIHGWLPELAPKKFQ